MKKLKLSPLSIIAVAIAMTVYTSALASEIGLNVSVGQSATVRQDKDRASATSSANIKAMSTSTKDNRASATSSLNRQNRNASSTGNGTSTPGSTTANSHRSAVSIFVQSLLRVADRDGGIGEQVRIIAQEQNDSATTTVAAINQVENRSSLKIFLFGSDYKNLGVIRSELAKTSKQIERLKVLVAQATDVENKAELEAQIELLQNDQAEIEQFVTLHEDRFSLFGWFVKLFNTTN